MVPLFRPEVQENRKKKIWTELGLQQCQMKKRLKRMPNKRKYIIEKNMKVHHYMFYFEPNAYIATLALTKKKFDPVLYFCFFMLCGQVETLGIKNLTLVFGNLMTSCWPHKKVLLSICF